MSKKKTDPDMDISDEAVQEYKGEYADKEPNEEQPGNTTSYDEAVTASEKEEEK